MTRKQNVNPWSGKEKMNQERRNPDCKSKNKVLLVTFFDIKGIVHYEYLEEGQTINKESYLNIMRRVRESIRLQRSEMWNVTRVIKTKGDMCMTEVTCFAANTSFKFILGAVYIHPGASMQDIGMLLWQGLGPYIHNSQYLPPFVQVDSSIPILLCGDFNKNKTAIIVAYRDCGLPFMEIGSRVGRNQTTVMWICDSWMQEGTTDRRVRSHPPQCTTSLAHRKIVRMAVTDRSVTSRTVAQHIQSETHHPVFTRTIRRRLQQSGLSARCPLLRLPLTQNHRRLHRQWCDERRMWTAELNEIVFTDESRFCLQHHDGRIRVWRHRGERMLNSCVMHCHTGPAPGIMVWGGIGYTSRTFLVRIVGTLNSQRYFSEVLEPVVLPYLQGLPTAIFQQDNARPHVARIVQKLFVNRQTELLPWPVRSPDLSPIENMWSMVAQRLTQITSSAATPDQLWQRMEAAWPAVSQEHIQSLFESMPRRVAANASAFVIKTGSTTQWQADLALKEMTASDMRNRRHVQPLLTWSTNATHLVSLDQEPLQGTKSRQTKISTIQNSDRDDIPADQNPDNPKFRQGRYPDNPKARLGRNFESPKSRKGQNIDWEEIPKDQNTGRNKIPTDPNQFKVKSKCEK
ncbi:hypothetical protein LAZ67_2001985 [Cordylochernes scorpioides]|uniref:Transposable element Tcb1 transposase n=1 Tax=Cordylochernes scorpioides TaxID=51811 RepID=A0ABY6K1P7_9ARAC|nr:hypothetical protein LAZ67_2001985 [Cordylochernes scorpioides]